MLHNLLHLQFMPATPLAISSDQHWVSLKGLDSKQIALKVKFCCFVYTILLCSYPVIRMTKQTEEALCGFTRASNQSVPGSPQRSSQESKLSMCLQ